MVCIFCDEENSSISVEHIVPESLGNTKYILPKSIVCDICNNKFSKFEDKALTETILLWERSRFGIKTKKGKSANGNIDNLKIAGDANFKKNLINVTGLNNENFSCNPQTNEGKVFVPFFPKNTDSISKLLLKIGIESIYFSQKQIFNEYKFEDLKKFLINKSNRDWPFIVSKHDTIPFLHIPNKTQRVHLEQIRCSLNYFEIDDNTLLFKFKYGSISIMINLLNRKTSWIKPIKLQNEKAELYPEHYRKKI